MGHHAGVRPTRATTPQCAHPPHRDAHTRHTAALTSPHRSAHPTALAPQPSVAALSRSTQLQPSTYIPQTPRRGRTDATALPTPISPCAPPRSAGWLLASDTRGRIFVLDKTALVLLRTYDPSAVPSASPHAGADGLNSPHAMAASATELFIADHNNHRLQVRAPR